MSGNCAIGSVRIATRPASTVTIAMTMATMGRLMKNLDMAYSLTEGTRTASAVTSVPS